MLRSILLRSRLVALFGTAGLLGCNQGVYSGQGRYIVGLAGATPGSNRYYDLDANKRSIVLVASEQLHSSVPTCDYLSATFAGGNILCLTNEPNEDVVSLHRAGIIRQLFLPVGYRNGRVSAMQMSPDGSYAILVLRNTPSADYDFWRVDLQSQTWTKITTLFAETGFPVSLRIAKSNTIYFLLGSHSASRLLTKLCYISSTDQSLKSTRLFNVAAYAVDLGNRVVVWDKRGIVLEDLGNGHATVIVEAELIKSTERFGPDALTWSESGDFLAFATLDNTTGESIIREVSLQKKVTRFVFRRKTKARTSVSVFSSP